MRVLDVGSGVGDVAILLAGLVGQKGEVVGADIAQTAIDTAESRVRASSLANVTFRCGDPATMNFDKPFDAVVGRYVLQFVPDPSTAIARLSSHLRPGGVMFFHELDWDGARSSPLAPTYHRVCGWIMSTIEASGAQIRLGAKLPSVFERAGLSRPTLRLESLIASGPAAIDTVHLVTDLVATLLPNMERMGLVESVRGRASKLGGDDPCRSRGRRDAGRASRSCGLGYRLIASRALVGRGDYQRAVRSPPRSGSPLHVDLSRPVSANSGHPAKTGERVKSDPNRKLPFFPQPTAIGRKAVICCIAGRNPTVSLRLHNSVKVEGSHDPM